MNTRSGKHPASWLVVGFALGVSVMWFFREEPGLALSTDRTDNAIVATAPWDEQETVEAVYVLDLNRARLVVTAVNPITGRFLGVAARDIRGDFQLNPRAGKPKFAMVGGRAALTGQTRFPVRHLLYVVEVNSGQIRAYTTPFTGYAAAAGVTLQIVPVDGVAYGAPIIRR